MARLLIVVMIASVVAAAAAIPTPVHEIERQLSSLVMEVNDLRSVASESGDILIKMRQKAFDQRRESV